ncbi:conserved hypothetical protein [Theileria equi strain WA]|uniref:Serine aminopeptidase S33 domain-containing protein n=1 Tax=Theileria equi strain WA TaxID=1537102 RepID=L1LCB2_THEEQ|nr:conserved hypothetical protein [Theileria equi strain WA]EKX72890.1 conserved hypothetical protein [Theileria equi strain WA]|eukprot:XP_004832342.1 conserved hypothetical protein [Theileria equi strain WA]
MGNALSCIIFKPPRPSYTVRDPHLHMIPGPNGYSIAAYFIKHRKAEFTVFFSHGNAEDIGNVFHSLLHRISNWNCNFFVYDYAGYGMSGGAPSEDNIYSDAEVAFDYMVKELGIDPLSVICFGRSLGSAPSMHIAVRRKICGLILQSPIASILRTKIKRLKLSFPCDMFCNIDIAPYIKVPTLIIHGTKDEIVPIYGSKKMARKIEEVYYLWVKGGMHNDLDYKYTRIMEGAIQEFLEILRRQKRDAMTNYNRILPSNDEKLNSCGLYKHGTCKDGDTNLYHSLDSIVTNESRYTEISRISDLSRHEFPEIDKEKASILAYEVQYRKYKGYNSGPGAVLTFAGSFREYDQGYLTESSNSDEITEKRKSKCNPFTQCFWIKTGV